MMTQIKSNTILSTINKLIVKPILIGPFFSFDGTKIKTKLGEKLEFKITYDDGNSVFIVKDDNLGIHDFCENFEDISESLETLIVDNWEYYQESQNMTGLAHQIKAHYAHIFVKC